MKVIKITEFFLHEFATFTSTGTGKSTIYRYLTDILRKVRTKLENEDMVLKSWLLSDQNFEKLGELMDKNDGKVLGLCDELTNLLSQLNLYSGATGLLDTHEFTKVLELFSGTAWSRQTGNTTFIYHPNFFKLR